MKLVNYLVYFGIAALTFFSQPVAAQLIPEDDPALSTHEDLSSASLASSQLRPAPPELEEKDEEPDYIREWVTVRWRANDPVYLYVVRPTGVKKPPAVIYLYNYPVDVDVFRDEEWCKRTTAGGYAAIGFVPALSGQRYHDRPMKEWFVSEMQEALAKSAHDVQMVLNYLADRGDVDVNHAGIFGVGAGGTIAVMAASVDPRIKAIDLVDPWGDWPVWMAKSAVIPNEERAAYVKPEFLKKIAAFDPVTLLPELKTPHIQLIQLTASQDAVPTEAQKKIEAALPPSAERNRFQDDANFRRALASRGGLLDWMKQQLKPDLPVKAEATAVKN